MDEGKKRLVWIVNIFMATALLAGLTFYFSYSSLAFGLLTMLVFIAIAALSVVGIKEPSAEPLATLGRFAKRFAAPAVMILVVCLASAFGGLTLRCNHLAAAEDRARAERAEQHRAAIEARRVAAVKAAQREQLVSKLVTEKQNENARLAIGEVLAKNKQYESDITELRSAARRGRWEEARSIANKLQPVFLPMLDKVQRNADDSFTITLRSPGEPAPPKVQETAGRYIKVLALLIGFEHKVMNTLVDELSNPRNKGREESETFRRIANKVSTTREHVAWVNNDRAKQITKEVASRKARFENEVFEAMFKAVWDPNNRNGDVNGPARRVGRRFGIEHHDAVLILAKNDTEVERRLQKRRAARERRCGKRPFVGAATVYLRQTAHDPRSIEVVRCETSEDRPNGCWIQECLYRGRNAFGALVLQRGRFHITRSIVTKHVPLR